MSCKRAVKSFRPVKLKIDCINKKTVEEIENSALAAINQKLEKLNIILKNLSVYCVEDTLLVNDRFAVCKDFNEIASSFGFEVRQIDCELKGRSYILQDGLVKILRTLNSQFTLNKFANSTLSSELIALIKKEFGNSTADCELIKILNDIKKQGYYSVSGTQQVTSIYYDNVIIGQRVEEVVSDKDRIEAVIKQFAQNAQTAIDKANENLRDGTVKLLYSRARQMGYSVKEERNGAQVQLVLVRAE